MDIFWAILAVIVFFTAISAWKYAVTQLGQYGREKMAKLDSLNAALSSIDTATTTLATNLTALLERVLADDISDADLQAAVENATALATRISDASTVVAGIEPTPIAVPPIDPPVEEPPVEEPPVEPPVEEGTNPTIPTP